MDDPKQKPDVKFKDFEEPVKHGSQSAAKMLHGRLIPPQQQIFLYSAAEWEIFIQEWVHYQKTKYHKVLRFSGANDMGIDVAAFVSDMGMNGIWDNYQCKHYKDSLTPRTGVLEIGKIIWHIYMGHITCPRKYYFLAPKDIGMSLKKFLLSPEDLKNKLFDKWEDWCSKDITSTKEITLDDSFQVYLTLFDFSIFTFKTAMEAIDEHRATPYYTARFGGGLPDRPKIETPPSVPTIDESRYIEQLFEAYSDHTGVQLNDINVLANWPKLLNHYHRQRENFYSAESLRNFARDTVPPETFSELQEEVYEGVVDLESLPQKCALTKVNVITQAAAQLPLTANGLISVTKVQDKKGICHQLANDDKLCWTENNEKK